MDRWPHQIQAYADVLAAIQEGEQRICLTSPTGGGKTRVASDLIGSFLSDQLPTVLYTNRTMLIEQTSRMLKQAGHSHGVNRGGSRARDESLLQVSMIQTEQKRLKQVFGWELHNAKRVIVDEAHLHTSPGIQQIINEHIAAGAVVIGMTATPIDLGHIYHKLIVAGTNSELRKCGALVPAEHFGPDEPDLRKVKTQEGDDLTAKENRSAIMRPGIFGRVSHWFKALNPDRRPSILFAPGVKESLWFAEQFCKIGISAAHIDGEEVWINGEWSKNNKEARAKVLAESAAGRTTVLCNRFVLREGIDAPWLSHGIFACVFGALQSYLQSGGRLLRAYPGLDAVTIQDHGGNWWRHGSLNADRPWDLNIPYRAYVGMRADKFRKKLEREPWRCPKCANINQGFQCFSCGWKPEKKHIRSRPVVTEAGTLTHYSGAIFRARATYRQPDGPAIWKRMYWRSRTEKGARTFAAAEALFARENNWQYPDPSWPLMPIDPLDRYKLVDNVDMNLLVPDPKSADVAAMEAHLDSIAKEE